MYLSRINMYQMYQCTKYFLSQIAQCLSSNIFDSIYKYICLICKFRSVGWSNPAILQLHFSYNSVEFHMFSATFQLHFRHISAVQLAKADVRHPIILPFCIFSVFLVFQWKVLCSVRGATSIWDGIISIIQFARKRGSKVWVKAGKFDLLNVFNFSFLHTFNIHLHIRKGNNICLPIFVVDLGNPQPSAASSQEHIRFLISLGAFGQNKVVFYFERKKISAASSLLNLKNVVWDGFSTTVV